jgi:hypothetical protein
VERRVTRKFNLGHILASIASLSGAMACAPKQFMLNIMVQILFFTAVVTIIAFVTSSSWISVGAWTSGAYPLLFVVSLHATWLAAWRQLGHRPRIYTDDPKFIGPPIDFLHRLKWELLAGWLPFFVLCCSFALYGFWASVLRGKKSVIGGLPTSAAPLASWFLALLLCQSDPLLIVYWFMD